MIKKDSQTNVMSLLPLTLGLWLGYLLALLLIDHLFYPRPIFPPFYYLINGSIALAVLALALWPPGRDLLETSFIFPLVIGLLSVVPVISSNLIIPPSGPGPAYSLESVESTHILTSSSSGQGQGVAVKSSGWCDRNGRIAERWCPSRVSRHRFQS